jgi:hypothetical protein
MEFLKGGKIRKASEQDVYINPNIPAKQSAFTLGGILL